MSRPVISQAVEPAQAEWMFPPRGLRREMAARYVGISPSHFDGWVAKGLMPQPKQQDGVVVWDRVKLDAAFEALPDRLKKGAQTEEPPRPGLTLVEQIDAQRTKPGPRKRCVRL